MLCFKAHGKHLLTAMISVPIGELHLYNNHLNGTLPTTIGQFHLLRSLYLDNNQLSGTIPAQIESMPLLGEWLHE